MPFAHPFDEQLNEVDGPPALSKTHFTKEEIVAPCHPYAKPPVVPEATAWVLLIAFAPMAGVLAATPLWDALRAWKRTQYTLQHLLVLTIALGGALLGGVGIWQAQEAAKTPAGILAWICEFHEFEGRDAAVTCHQVLDDEESWKLSVYLVDQGEYQHQSTYYCNYGARFEKPVHRPYREGGFELELLVLAVNYMSPSNWAVDETVLCMGPGPKLIKIPVEDAYSGMQRFCPLRENEGIWKSGGPPFWAGDFVFGFIVSVECKNRDRDGTIAMFGRYKLIRHRGELRFVVAEAHRECFGEGPHVAQLFELCNAG